jgi:hypothetical protein
VCDNKENANKNNIEIYLTSVKMAIVSIIQTNTNAGGDAGREKHFYTLSGNAN